jgi:hypothetical protein
MDGLIFRVCAALLFLTAPVHASALYQVEPFSLKLDGGQEVTVFTYNQNNAVSIALRIVGPGDAQLFISAIHAPDSGTLVTVLTPGGSSYKIRRPSGKPIAVYDDQEKPVPANPKFLADCTALYDQIEALRQAVAAKVAANAAVNADAVGPDALRNIIVAAKALASK